MKLPVDCLTSYVLYSLDQIMFQNTSCPRSLFGRLTSRDVHNVSLLSQFFIFMGGSTSKLFLDPL